MSKKQLICFVILLSFMIFISGCSLFGRKSVTINLQLPTNVETWDVQIVTEMPDGGWGDNYKFYKIPSNQLNQQVISVKKGTESIMMLLFRDGDIDSYNPEYICITPYILNQTEYWGSSWIKYSDYMN